MAIIFTQTDTAAQDGAIEACSGNTNPATNSEATSQMSEGGTAGTTAQECKNSANETGVRCIYFQSAPGEPNDDDWESGDWTVRINVTTGNSNCTLQEVHVCRVNSSGVSQATIGSATALGITLSAGVKTVTVSGSADAGAAATDEVYIVCVVDFGGAHGNEAFSITPDQNIDSPLTVTSTQSVTGEHIASGTSLFSATVDVGPVEVTTAHIASAAVLNAPTVSYEVVASNIPSATSLFAPTVDPGPVAVTGAHIASALALNAPSLAHAVVTAHIPSGTILNAPSVAYDIQVANIPSGASLFAPTLNYEVLTASIPSGTTLFGPDVSQAGGDQSVTGAHITSSLVLSAPTVAHVVDTAHITSTTSLFAPTLSHEVVAGTIASGASLFSPSVVQNVTGASIPSGAALFSPDVSHVVGMPTIASGSTLFAPTVAHEILTVSIPSGSVLFAPSVTAPQDVTAGHITSTLVLWGASVSREGDMFYTISLEKSFPRRY